ncbi:MAG: hypothetical protein IT341_06975 [Chloroflexi bacterium]|nr:hypothetical protein [Chloroflexota bacterium]
MSTPETHAATSTYALLLTKGKTMPEDERPAEQPQGTTSKETPPAWGFAVAGILLWIGLLLIAAPPYVGFGAPWSYILYGLTAVVLFFSFVGTFIELERSLKNEGLSYIGVGLALLLPSGILAWAEYSDQIALFRPAVRLAVLLLAALGGTFAIGSLPYLAWKRPPSGDPPAPDPEEQAEAVVQNRPGGWEVFARILVGMVSLLTAILALLKAILAFME